MPSLSACVVYGFSLHALDSDDQCIVWTTLIEFRCVLCVTYAQLLTSDVGINTLVTSLCSEGGGRVGEVSSPCHMHEKWNSVIFWRRRCCCFEHLPALNAGAAWKCSRGLVVEGSCYVILRSPGFSLNNELKFSRPWKLKLWSTRPCGVTTRQQSTSVFSGDTKVYYRVHDTKLYSGQLPSSQPTFHNRLPSTSSM
jgi:hypothetical protein